MTIISSVLCCPSTPVRRRSACLADHAAEDVDSLRRCPSSPPDRIPAPRRSCSPTSSARRRSSATCSPSRGDREIPMRAAALRTYRELLQAAWVREVPVGPVDETLARVGRVLRAAEIPFAVAGGFAVIEHGYERFTKDVDLLVYAPDLP